MRTVKRVSMVLAIALILSIIPAFASEVTEATDPAVEATQVPADATDPAAEPTPEPNPFKVEFDDEPELDEEAVQALGEVINPEYAGEAGPEGLRETEETLWLSQASVPEIGDDFRIEDVWGYDENHRSLMLGLESTEIREIAVKLYAADPEADYYVASVPVHEDEDMVLAEWSAGYGGNGFDRVYTDNRDEDEKDPDVIFDEENSILYVAKRLFEDGEPETKSIEDIYADDTYAVRLMQIWTEKDEDSGAEAAPAPTTEPVEEPAVEPADDDAPPAIIPDGGDDMPKPVFWTEADGEYDPEKSAYAPESDGVMAIDRGTGTVFGDIPSGQILEAYAKYLGTPYRLGGKDPGDAFDCSGYVGYVAATDLGVDFRHAPGGQYYNGWTTMAFYALFTEDWGLTSPEYTSVGAANAVYGSKIFPGDVVIFCNSQKSGAAMYVHAAIVAGMENGQITMYEACGSDVHGTTMKGYWDANANGRGDKACDFFYVFRGTNTHTPSGNPFKLRKESANTAFTDGNSCYSLAGAVYAVYEDAGCTKELERGTTNDAGEINFSKGYTEADYFIKEIAASPGYLLDPTVYHIHLDKDGNVTRV